MVRPPDTRPFDEWVARWPNARLYCIVAGGGREFAGSAMGTPAFHEKVGNWIRFWADHIRKLGLEPEQVLLLLVDEPSTPDQDSRILAWARALQDAGTGVRIFEDPIHDPPQSADEEMIARCDVLCPNRRLFLEGTPEYRDYYLSRTRGGDGGPRTGTEEDVRIGASPSYGLQAGKLGATGLPHGPEKERAGTHPRGRQLMFYSCSGPARLLDPYTYYRLQPWTCRRFGAVGSFYWAFGDGGGASSWNEYVTTRFAYTPLFLDETGVTAGKHMEAIREGVQDYEYFVMLEALLARIESEGGPRDLRDRARRLLESGPIQVTEADGAGSFYWRDKKDRGMADEVRRRILEVLEAAGKLGRWEAGRLGGKGQLVGWLVG